MSDEMHNLLAALVEQARALATRIAGDPERESPCHFCGAPLPLWENLLVMQLAGVPAHVQCPEEALKARLRQAGPEPEFPYEDFCRAVEDRIKIDHPPVCAGTIELAARAVPTAAVSASDP